MRGPRVETVYRSVGVPLHFSANPPLQPNRVARSIGPQPTWLQTWKLEKHKQRLVCHVGSSARSPITCVCMFDVRQKCAPGGTLARLPEKPCRVKVRSERPVDRTFFAFAESTYRKVQFSHTYARMLLYSLHYFGLLNSPLYAYPI